MRKIILALCLVLGLSASPSAASEGSLGQSDRTKVLRAAAEMIEKRYSLQDRAARVARALRLDAASDRFKNITDPSAFAEAVSNRLQEVSKDGHLSLDYKDPKGAAAAEATADFTASELERWYGAHLNYGIEKIERLKGNVGYLDLRIFPPGPMAGDVVSAAMTVLSGTDALIIDLRENGGGMNIELVAAYLFDGGKQPLSGIFDRPTNQTNPGVVPDWVPGRRFGSKKPVYVLISKNTFSAAEAFAYDLQALKRVTVIGERSGGGANPFEYREVLPGWYMSLSEQLSINPITKSNWQDVGVKPDVEVAAAGALKTALTMAHAAIERCRQSQGACS